jgi:pyruvate,water dikinase
MDTIVRIPADLPEEDIVFSSYELVPSGKVEGVRYVIFVDPTIYRNISDQTVKLEIGRTIGRLNKRLEDRSFIIMGPGRWGSANIDLGVRVSYADIYNTKALVEMSVISDDGIPSLSYGTHFYQDLVETGIYSLPLHLADPRSKFRWDLFKNGKNQLTRLLPDDGELDPYLKVIDFQQEAEGRRLTILMDGSKDEAVGYLVTGTWDDQSDEKGTISTF